MLCWSSIRHGISGQLESKCQLWTRCMVEIVEFADAKLPHARKRRDAKAKAMKQAFAASRGSDETNPKKDRKKARKKKK